MGEPFSVTRRINFAIPTDTIPVVDGNYYDKGLSSNSEIETDSSGATTNTPNAYPLIQMNRHCIHPELVADKVEGGWAANGQWPSYDSCYGNNFYREFGFPTSQYIIVPAGRVVQAITVTYYMGSLPIASIPLFGNDTSDVEKASKQRDWLWNESHKEIMFQEVPYVGRNVYVDDEWRGVTYRKGTALETTQGLGSWGTTSGYLPPEDRGAFILPPSVRGQVFHLYESEEWGYNFHYGNDAAFKGLIPMRRIEPFHNQAAESFFNYELSFDTGISVLLRHTPAGRLTSADWVSITGSYKEYFEIMPKRAIGVIA